MFQSSVQQAIMLAQQQMRQNPDMANNADTNQMMNALQSGNAQAGEQMANQIIQKLGISKEQAIQQAMRGLQQRGIRF